MKSECCSSISRVQKEPSSECLCPQHYPHRHHLPLGECPCGDADTEPCRREGGTQSCSCRPQAATATNLQLLPRAGLERLEALGRQFGVHDFPPAFPLAHTLPPRWTRGSAGARAAPPGRLCEQKPSAVLGPKLSSCLNLWPADPKRMSQAEQGGSSASLQEMGVGAWQGWGSVTVRAAVTNF